MPVKILLADKSITIQKVVEMLFSGKEYEVTCVSDGEAAISEASRIIPDVVLADVDLPRLDGYSLAERMKQTEAVSQTPVVLMMSRDDQYNANRGASSGIVDHIAKPFESQDLIGKVKKALSAAVSRPAAASQSKPAAAAPARPSAAPAPPQSKPKAAVPSDIFGIIADAPTKAAPAPSPAPKPRPAVQEDVFEVEPEIEVEPEVEEQVIAAPAVPKRQPSAPAAADAFDTDKLFGKEPPAPLSAVPESPALEVEAEILPEPVGGFEIESTPTEVEKALPVGQKALDEMREGLGLGERAPFAAPPKQSDFVSFESLDMASRVSREEYSFEAPSAAEETRKAPPQKPEPPAAAPSFRPSAVSDEALQGISQEAVARMAREVLERVAWEVIPDLAERLIREEIERLKAGS